MIPILLLLSITLIHGNTPPPHTNPTSTVSPPLQSPILRRRTTSKSKNVTTFIWTHLQPKGPYASTFASGASGLTATYDPIHNHAVLYGGTDNTSTTLNTWINLTCGKTDNTAILTEILVTSPEDAIPANIPNPPLKNHASVTIHDEKSNKLLLIGGTTSALDNTAWSKSGETELFEISKHTISNIVSHHPSGAESPHGRALHAMVSLHARISLDEQTVRECATVHCTTGCNNTVPFEKHEDSWKMIDNNHNKGCTNTNLATHNGKTITECRDLCKTEATCYYAEIWPDQSCDLYNDCNYQRSSFDGGKIYSFGPPTFKSCVDGVRKKKKVKTCSRLHCNTNSKFNENQENHEPCNQEFYDW